MCNRYNLYAKCIGGIFEMEIYEITQFLIIEINKDDAVIMTDSNVVNLTNSFMIEFLKEIELYQKNEISYSYISDYFEEDTDEAIEFLMNNGLLNLKKTKELKYKKVNYIVNDMRIFELLSVNTKGIDTDLRIEYSKSIRDTLSIIKNNVEEEDYTIIVMNPFNFKDLHKIVEASKDRDLMIKIVFFYNYSFYFTNIYKDTWGTPCPICFFSNLEATLRGEAKFSSYDNFQTIMDIVYSKKETFLVGYNYKEYQLSFLVSNLIFEVKELKDHDICIVKRIDMNDNSIEYDSAYHWELCDCYE